MALKELIPWRRGGLRRVQDEDRPLQAFRRDLHREMDRLFEDLWHDAGRSPLLSELWSGEAWPSIDETEDDKGYHIAVELPGMDEKDIDITLAEGLLTIRGEKKQEDEEKGRDFYRRERSFGSFRRVIALPGEVDESKIQASFRKGVLKVELPKTEDARKKARRIDVKPG